MKNKRLTIIIASLMILTMVHPAYAEQPDMPNHWQSQISPFGSSFKTLINGELEFILMDGWSLFQKNQYEYIITRDIDGEAVEIGGIEVLTRERSSMPSKIFTNLKDSGGSYILIEDRLLEKENHSQYHIKWIKDKRYYIDVYIMNSGISSYHITLTSELKYFGDMYQQFENFISTLDIRREIPGKNVNVYYNNVDKYVINLPEGWQVDNRNEFAGTAFTAEGIGKLWIYKQQLNGINPNTYIWYSNKKLLEGSSGIQVLSRNDKSEGQNRIVQFIWTRPEIKTLGQDFNYYYEINMIPENEDVVYTFIMKTDRENMEDAFTAFQDILSSFTPADYGFKTAAKEKVLDDIEVLMEGNKIKLQIPGDKTLWGIFSAHTPGYYLDGLRNAEANLGHRFELVMTYTSFASPFPEKDVSEMYADGRVMMLTLHPWEEGNLNDIMIPGIVSGDYDEYIKSWAAGIKKLGEPVFFRFANEMNGDWDPWCAWFYGKDHDLFIEAWKRIHRIFKEEGADNACFVWNPHDRSFPDFKWNNPHLYYPGDEYVDWVGLTGYNNGTSYDWDRWRDFGPIYSGIYDEYSALYPDKPLIITEFASNEVGGDKAAWIKDAFEKLAEDFPRIKIAVWFNQVDGRWQYPIYSSPEARAAFINGLKHQRFNFKAIQK